MTPDEEFTATEFTEHENPPSDSRTYLVREPAQRETTRRWLAYGLVGLLALMALMAQIALLTHQITSEEFRELTSSPTAAAVTTLAATACGFFFGRESGDRK